MPNSAKGLNDTVLNALKAIGTGIGVLGFVAFAGGGLIWLRFYALNLPANYAVSVVPRNELLATGASFIAFAAALSLAAAALAFAFASTLRRVVEPVLLYGHTAARKTALRIARKPEPEPEAKPRWLDKAPALASGFLVGLVGIGIAIWFWIEDGTLVFLFLVLVAVVSGAIAYLALKESSTLVWSLAGVFCAVAIYATAFQAVRTYHAPKIEPMAIVLNDGATADGALVAETGTVLYLAERQSDGRWDVRRFARTEVKEQAVGALATRGQIAGYAQTLLAALEAHPS